MQQHFTHQVLKTMLCAWKSACLYENSYREKQLTIVKSLLIKWIRNRRIQQSNVVVREQSELLDQSIISNDPIESIVPKSVQDCQFDLSSSDICPTKVTAQTRNNNLNIQNKTLHIQLFYFKDSFFAWRFVVCNTQIKRNQEIALYFQVLKQWK